MTKPVLVLLVLALLPPGCGQSTEGPLHLTLYAATSLRDALEEVAPHCEEETGARFIFNFAATSTLARQITAANRADIFIPADEDWMKVVEEAGLAPTGGAMMLLVNSLVVIAPAGSVLRIRSAEDLVRDEVTGLALALPEAVPAGKYARRWLEASGVWDDVAARVVPVADVRAALATVESGLVPVGIVYRTDAATSMKVRILLEIPPGEGPGIAYPVAVMSQRPHVRAAERLVQCLDSPPAREIFARFGFVDP